MSDLMTHSAVKNKIARAAGGYAKQIFIDLDHLVEEVRQEAIFKGLEDFRKPKFKVMSDRACAAYLFEGLRFAASGLIDKHLGSRTDDGTGRTKGLSGAPYKWKLESDEQADYEAIPGSLDKIAYSDQTQSRID